PFPGGVCVLSLSRNHALTPWLIITAQFGRMITQLSRRGSLLTGFKNMQTAFLSGCLSPVFLWNYVFPICFSVSIVVTVKAQYRIPSLALPNRGRLLPSLCCFKPFWE